MVHLNYGMFIGPELTRWRLLDTYQYKYSNEGLNMSYKETQKREWTTPEVKLLDKAGDAENGSALGPDGFGLS